MFSIKVFLLVTKRKPEAIEQQGELQNDSSLSSVAHKRVLSLYGPWPYGLAQWPIFLFQEFWEIDKTSHFSISKSKGVYQLFSQFENNTRP